MDKIKRYIECYISTETCNLRCHYCYIAQQRKFNNKLFSLQHSKESIRQALSINRLGGVCMLNFCAGGETLLSDEVIPLVKEIIDEGHYATIVTNGTLRNRFKEITELSDKIRSHLFIKFSFHYLEFKRLGLIDRFFENVQMMKDSEVSFTVEITPSDELVPYISEIKSICMEKLGALCHVTIARDDRTSGIEVLSKYSFDEYKKIWGTFDSDLFKFKSSIFYLKRKEFCYAGEWSIYLDLNSGNYRQCYCGKYLGNIYNNIEEPLHFEVIGNHCPFSHCYNGHSFLTLGDIPELNTPSYATLRNRVCSDGTSWLQKDMKNFMESKLIESNDEYSNIKKAKISANNRYNDFRQKLHNIKQKLL
ncbi:MAG: radical SAM protein [Ruminococcus sp.]|nr:radical SAM protein [Ruminococcus sp.]